MSPRSPEDRLRDILEAIEKIEEFTAEGFPDLSARSPVWDAVVHNIAVIGEAVKALPASVQELADDVEWSMLARMRDFLMHRYFDVEHLVIKNAVEDDIPRLREAVETLLARVEPSGN